MGQIGRRWSKIAPKLVQQGSKIAIILFFPFSIPFLFISIHVCKTSEHDTDPCHPRRLHTYATSAAALVAAAGIATATTILLQFVLFPFPFPFPFPFHFPLPLPLPFPFPFPFPFEWGSSPKL